MRSKVQINSPSNEDLQKENHSKEEANKDGKVSEENYLNRGTNNKKVRMKIPSYEANKEREEVSKNSET